MAARLATDFGQGGSTVVVLFQARGRTDAASPAFQDKVSTALDRVRTDSRVGAVVGYAQTGASQFVSKAGDATYVLLELDMTADQAINAVDGIGSEIATPPGMSVQITGSAALSAAMSAQSESDLSRAETISLPIALVILLLVFGSLVAAGLPLFVAGLTIPTTLAIVWVLAQRITMSVFVSSVVTMLGLALAIDYSLFMVSRFREELACGATVEEAIERTVATSGKAVAFSGSAVAIGLSGLLLFRAPTISSMGIGGALIAICSVAYALTFLPAALSILGPRVERLRIPNPFSRPTAAAGATSQSTSISTPASSSSTPPVEADQSSPAKPRGRWERLAEAVMARPVAVLVPILVLLLALGLPFLGATQGVPGANVLPAGIEARTAWDTIETQFPAGETSPIDVLVTVAGDPLSSRNAAALTAYSARLAALSGVSMVEGPFSLAATSGQPLPSSAVAAALAAPASSRPAALNSLLASTIRGSTVHLQVISPLAGTQAAQALVQTVRNLAPGPGLSVAVGGTDASALDFLNAQNEQMPLAIGFILVAMALMLMLQFGSVVLPVKAVLMTLLSLTASFGALVWIFQDGHLSGLLGFTSPGYTVATIPILMFAVIFGLSMDYEVLLLSRIQESYRKTGDTRRAVAEGLSRSGRVITGAALIMVTVFAAFGLADMIVIKSLGIGMAIAVLLDATIIRALLVPATMRLLGRWAWWAPARLSRVTHRLGFNHVATDYECDSPEPETRPEPPEPGTVGRPGRLAGPPAAAAG